MRQVQRAGASFFRLARCAGLGDMGQGVGAGVGDVTIEIGRGIRRPADAQGIHHHKEGTRHQLILSCISGGSGAASPMRIAARTACTAASA